MTIPGNCLCLNLCHQDELGEFDGGVLIGGSADVCHSGTTYQDMAVWPLFEAASPYVDQSSLGWDGTATSPPTQTAGVYCNWGQLFEGREWIELEEDNIPETNAFSVSMWVTIHSYYEQRQWFSRGNPFVFSFGHSVMNTLWARVVVPQSGGEEEISVFGDTILDRDRWYHVAVVFVPGSYLRVYINGVQDGSTDIDEFQTVEKSGLNYIARANDSTGPEGKMQEVRLHLRDRDADWWDAEVDNFCSSDFYTVDETVETGVFE